MNIRRLSGLTLTAAALASLAAACGPAGDAGTGTETTATTTTTTTRASVFEADLAITIGTTDRAGEFEATLRCGADAVGTGYLTGTAVGACEFLAGSSEAQTLLSEGPPTDRVCTEIYGGGEVADITGAIARNEVAVAIDRVNGCGIADWDILQPLLVEPYDLARRNAAGACSAATAPAVDADQGELPPAVSELRTALLNGATSCDLEGLAARAIDDGTNVSFGGSEDPAGLWRDLESRGATPMADLIAVLQLKPGTIDDGQGTIFWVWPAVAALDDWNDATEEQRAELASLFGADALADWDLFGGYIGYRVGITEAGRWAFFVEGD